MDYIRSLFGTSSNLSTVYQDEYASWKLWQNKQTMSHYTHSDLYQYFMTCNPNIILEDTFGNNKYYKYCFGDFTKFISYNNNSKDPITYLTLLLLLYDTCKGITRKISDPTGIAILRSSVNKRRFDELRTIDYSIYDYKYYEIHAHTIVQYSLSTFIMFLIGNFFQNTFFDKVLPYIDQERCKIAHKNQVFGDILLTPVKMITSDIVTIPSKTEDSTVSDGFSPRSWQDHINCSACNRKTERTWGNFKLCLDCHVKNKCSVCCGTAMFISPNDNLPKCYQHR